MRRQLIACLLTAAVLSGGCRAAEYGTAAGRESASPGGEYASLGHESASPEQEPTPPEHEATPPGHRPVKPAPAELGTAPPEKKPATAERKNNPSQNTPAQLPALPLWGEPGLHLVREQGRRGSAFAYAPLDLLGTTLQPVRLRQGTAYVRVEGDAVYLHGVNSIRGGFSLLAEPALLHRLPVQVGDIWTVRIPGPMGDGYTYTVAAIEPVETPGGVRQAARIEVTRNGWSAGTEWWVPGYGLVGYTDGSFSWRAERELMLEPELPAVIGRLAPGMQALLWDDGDEYWITTLDGKQELFRAPDVYWRSWYDWADAGEHDLLAHTLYPGSWGIYRFTAFRYDPEEGRFRQLDWVSEAGTVQAVAGDGGWGPGGAFHHEDFLGYPTRIQVYRFDGEAMRADPAEEQVFRARSEMDFIRRLMGPPLLREADIVAMFRDPATAEGVLGLLQELHAGGYTGPDSIKPMEGTPGAFLVTEGSAQFLAKVEQHEHDYVITRFERLADGE